MVLQLSTILDRLWPAPHTWQMATLMQASRLLASLVPRHLVDSDTHLPVMSLVHCLLEVLVALLPVILLAVHSIPVRHLLDTLHPRAILPHRLVLV